MRILENIELYIFKFLIYIKFIDIEYTDGESTTLLMLASLHNSYIFCEYLLQNGANVNARTNYGYTALLFASINADTKFCKLLIDYGADVLVENKNGFRASNYCDTTSSTYVLLKQREKEQELLNQSFKRARVEDDSDDEEDFTQEEIMVEIENKI